MPDSIKISKLVKIQQTDLSPSDQIVINDADRSDGQIVTHRTDLAGVQNFITGQELTFSSVVNFSNEVVFQDNITLQGQITLDPTVDLVNFTLGRLSDVEVGAKTDGQVLSWSDAVSAWVPIEISIDTYTKAESDTRFARTTVVGSVEPATPVTGQLWFDTPNNLLMVYDGSAFIKTRPDGMLITDGLATGFIAPPASVVPQSNYSQGTPGQFVADGDYVFFCISPNNWVRTRIVPFGEDTAVIETE